MLLTLCACGGAGGAAITAKPSPEQTAEPTPEPTPAPTPEPTPEPRSSFVEQGLAERVVNLSEAEGEVFHYHHHDTVGRREADFSVEMKWADFDFKTEEPTVYYPEGAEPFCGSDTYSDFCSELVEAIEAKLDDPSLYEWRGACADYRIGENTWYGFKLGIEDYYDAELWDESKQTVNLGLPNVSCWSHTLVYEGQEYTVYEFWGGIPHFESDGSLTNADLFQFCCVPKGYDGLVFVLYGTRNDSIYDAFPTGQHFYDYIDDSTLFFRLADARS